jgi:glycosyltransferase involved in cell wall biosynthesis
MPITDNLLPKATVIISVYNNLSFLKLVLAGFEMQTEQNFEIIVSDDGSGEDFRKGLLEIIATSPLRIVHNWHEDIGFRKNRILNRSIQKARAPYLIFVDGDCIPHPHFVAEHLQHAQKKVCLVGRRVDLSAGITRKLTAEKVRAGVLQSPGLFVEMLKDYIGGKLGHLKAGLYVKNGLLRRWLNSGDRGLLGANFSIHKVDLVAINGFDERYRQPTFGEDSDIELRLGLNGVKFMPVISVAVMYHCHHKLLPRPSESKELYESAVKENRAFTPFGIIKQNPDYASLM